MRMTTIALLGWLVTTGAAGADPGHGRDHLFITVPAAATSQLESIAARAPQQALLFAGGVRLPAPGETGPREAAYSSVLDLGPLDASRLLMDPARHRRHGESAAAFGERLSESSLIDTRRLQDGSLVTRTRVERLLTGELLVSIRSVYESEPGAATTPAGPVTRVLLEPEMRPAPCPYPVDTRNERNLYALKAVSFEASGT